MTTRRLRAALVVLAAASPAALSAQTAGPTLDVLTAPAHAGETATVCGQVVMAYCNAERGVRLTLATPPASPPVYIRVPLADRAKFGPRPEEHLTRQAVCVTGTIQKRRTAVVIELTDPAALRAPAAGPVAPFPSAAREPCDVPQAVMPRVVKEVKAGYPKEALKRRASGIVWLQGVVGVDGRIAHARVAQGVDRHLDARAVKALKEWRFEPARLDGAVVPMIVTIQMGFALKR